MKVPIAKPYFGDDEAEALRRPLQDGWVAQGPRVEAFEARFSSFAESRCSVATSSGTAALHVAVAALGLKPGDEVIVPAFTWVATPNVVEYMGATPVFCDVELRTFNIDTQELEALISPRTVGIIPVHLFGLCADMRRIAQIAAKHELWVVEDAACALGARQHGQHAGTFGDMAGFSFHPRKLITTGEGGMVTTQRGELERLARILRDHGGSLSGQTDQTGSTRASSHRMPEYEHLGYNYRLTDLQAALGCVQLERAAWILEQRSRHARRYDEMLGDLAALATPTVPEDYHHAYQSYVCLFAPESPEPGDAERLHTQRNALMAGLQAKGVETRPGTHAPVTLGYYAKKYDLDPQRFPNACLAERLSLALPLYAQMTSDEQDFVVESLKALVAP